jgi:hypothetical protein
VRKRAAIILVVALVLIATTRVVLGGAPSVTDLRSAPTGRADARVDGSVTDAELAELGRTVESSASYVEQLFERRFVVRPKLLLFGNTAAFSSGLSDFFKYSEGDVALSASSYGGIFDHATSTIAVNLQAIGAADRTATLEHELTHFMMRELTAGHDLPAWLEEGVATLAERHAENGSRWPDEDALVGHAIAAGGRVSLAQLETLSGWHATYPRFGQTLYLFVKNAASEVRSRIGWRGVLAALGAVGAGRPFADVYLEASGESLRDLEERIRQDRAPRLISRRLPSGDAQWTLFTPTPLAEEKVTIAGNSTYTVSFTVRTDDIGIYRGSFGSTAPPGTYLVSASGARAELATERR